jgi:uncharacterized protein YjbI with pentapeptide repeats
MSRLSDLKTRVAPGDGNPDSRPGHVILALALLVLLLAVIRLGYAFSWTGFAEYHGRSGEYHRAKDLWDWLQLLLLPGVLAWATASLRRRQGEPARAAEDSHSEEDGERERLSEEVLLRYFDVTGQLMLENGLRTAPADHEVRQLARARTLAALRELDGKRKGSLLLFLRETDLVPKHHVAICLQGADLSGADLRGAMLDCVSLAAVDLRGANLAVSSLKGADLKKADLSEIDLSGSDLRTADLKGAILTGALLSVADLRDADLSGADLLGANFTGANLQGVNLSRANLSGANFRGANLTGANLSKANLHVIELRGANLSNANLGEANLKEATLSEADLGMADLTRAQLKRADLRDVAGLQQDQIDSALGDGQTKLPQGFGRPKAWS